MLCKSLSGGQLAGSSTLVQDLVQSSSLMIALQTAKLFSGSINLIPCCRIDCCTAN
jgi:hypothetical protein